MCKYTIALLVVGSLVLALCNGQTNEDHRIINGKDAVRSEFPWIVNMVNRGGNNHRCGGVILNADWVLTAGHCVKDDPAIDLVAGDHNRNEQDSTKQRRTVSEIIRHPSYQPTSETNLGYDFALLKVSSPFVLSDSVKSVILPRPSSSVTGVVTIAGWGLINVPQQIIPNTLQKVNLTVVPFETCKAQFAGSVEITGTMMCAQDARSSPCNGDSGSGLVQIRNLPTGDRCKTHVLYGVVSFGKQGCDGGTTRPSVYGFVSSVLEWIRQLTGVEGPVNPATPTTCGIEDNNSAASLTFSYVLFVGLCLFKHLLLE